MRINWSMVALVAMVVCLGGMLLLHAQGTQQTSFVSNPGPLSGCPTPTAGKDSLCDVVGAGWEQSINGAAYTPLSGVTSTITSVFGRTGAVTAGTGDYTYSQLSSPPTKVNCPAASLGQTGLIASGCTIN